MVDQKSIHLIGIGGIGMSGIANLLVELEYEVSGSDLKDSNILANLRCKGAEISIGHQSQNVLGAELVVVSSAIPEDNPELKMAKEQEIPILKRAEMVARLMKDWKGIAISGTHGKTTTTSMITTILEKNNLDPTSLIGGKLGLIGGNSKLGSGDYFITEADESDGSLLFMEPEIGIVTNIEDDHLDHYGSRKKIEETFVEFLNKLPAQGVGIVCIDDPGVLSIIDQIESNLITYGLESEADLTAQQIELNNLSSQAVIYWQGQRLGQLKLRVPGKYNLLNALAAIAQGLHIGLDFEEIATALYSFTGVGRRFEKKGEYRGATVVDDYAHHPTELQATLTAAKNADFKRVIAVFQPHRYSRTELLLEDFSKSFAQADEVIITDIYAAGEEPIPGLNSKQIVDLINKSFFRKATFISELEGVYDYLQEVVEADDLVLTLGAGDVWKVGERLVAEELDSDLKASGELTMEV
ncbi:UDP-N-acetylmuramate--L-alanine ligase [Fuchsiella alkaliacetigena]|uniref:UDP-N-acetylmuramate--L-alanine ligase n=1 Tax=Fuchsiella alkaliacetigena TaxID=957042 RepID=UPI00200B3014|nr:UDP-N-acetylmuramate--L-alanine ligase [Fuchsiella alkaliacetigena]MCK8823672.1 UDP-N-acetylmuramate--L-alanine ligase [Fuchsiella alkaliacetigena]